MQVINTIAPLFLIVLLGALLRIGGFASVAFFSQINRLVFWVGLPALLFCKSAQPVADWHSAGQLVLTLLAVLPICGAAGWLLCAALRAPRRQRAAATQAAFRGNLAYVGLPIILYALSEGDASHVAPLTTLAVLALATVTPTYNIVGILVLLAGQTQHGAPASARRQALRAARLAVTNPLVLSCVAGVAYAQLVGQPLPALVARTGAVLGDMTVPLALLGVGAFINFEHLRGHAVLTIGIALVKVALAPLCGYAIARAIGLPPELARLALIYLACPTAVAAFVMADQMEGDAALTAGVLAISTLLSIVTLTLALIVPV